MRITGELRLGVLANMCTCSTASPTKITYFTALEQVIAYKASLLYGAWNRRTVKEEEFAPIKRAWDGLQVLWAQYDGVDTDGACLSESDAIEIGKLIKAIDPCYGFVDGQLSIFQDECSC